MQRSKCDFAMNKLLEQVAEGVATNSSAKISHVVGLSKLFKMLSPLWAQHSGAEMPFQMMNAFDKTVLQAEKDAATTKTNYYFCFFRSSFARNFCKVKVRISAIKSFCLCSPILNSIYLFFLYWCRFM